MAQAGKNPFKSEFGFGKPYPSLLTEGTDSWHKTEQIPNKNQTIMFIF